MSFMSTMCYGQSHETVLEFGPYDNGTIRDYKTDERIDKLPKKYTNQYEEAYCTFLKDTVRIYLLVYDADNMNDNQIVVAMKFALKTADISFCKGKAGDEIVGFKIADNETTFIALRKDERKSVVMEYPLKNKRYQMVHNYSLQAQQFAFVLGVNEILEPTKLTEHLMKVSRYFLAIGCLIIGSSNSSLCHLLIDSVNEIVRS